MTADTYSNTLGVLLMGTGNDNNTWGSNQNTAVFQILEDAIANVLTSSVTGGTLDLSGTPPPAATSQVRYSALIFSGVLASNQVVQVPNLTKFWWVKNATSGAFTLKLKTPSGSASIAIPQNSGWQLVHCDGADGIVVSPYNSVQAMLGDGSAAAPPYGNVNEASGWYRFGTQDWRLSINSTDVLRVTGPGAATPSIFNVLSPIAFQIQGAQVPAPGTEFAYAGIQLPSGRYLWENGVAYSRPIANGGSVDTYQNLFNAITVTCTGNTHSNGVVDGLSVDLTSYGLVGAYIEGTGVPTGTTITAISPSTFQLSASVSGTSTGVSFRILPWGQGDASTTFNVPDRRERTLYGRGGMGGTSTPGRITSPWDAMKLNTALGTDTFTLSQGNLPNITLSVAIAAGQGLHEHNFTIVQPGTTSPFQPTGDFNGVATGNVNPATLPAMSGTASLGGSGTAVHIISPGGVTNYIIAY